LRRAKCRAETSSTPWWWIPRGYDPWVHDPRFAGAPRLAAVEGRGDAVERRDDVRDDR